MSWSEREYLSLDTQGFHRIVYNDWGPKDGNVVICVHGLTGNGHDFDYLAEDLVQHGHRLICVDLPGRGRSDFLKNPLDYNYNQYLADLSALLARLKINKPKSVDWLGVSLGGLLGIRMAGLPFSPVKRLILNDVGPIVPQAALDFITQVISQKYVFENIAQLEDRMKATRGLTWGPLTDEQWKHMAEHNARGLPDGTVTYGYDPAIAEVFKVSPIGDLGMWPVWDQIKVPSLLIRGGQSVLLTLDIVAEMSRRKPGTPMDFVEFADCGHVPSLMAPEHIEAVRAWLNTPYAFSSRA